MKAIYLNNWADSGEAGMLDDFELKATEYKGVKVLLASYGTPSYEGSAYVFYEKDGKLFEVHGSHCSCYGLENQWSPEEVTLADIQHRLDAGALGAGEYDENPFADELRLVLKRLKRRTKPSPILDEEASA